MNKNPLRIEAGDCQQGVVFQLDNALPYVFSYPNKVDGIFTLSDRQAKVFDNNGNYLHWIKFIEESIIYILLYTEKYSEPSGQPNRSWEEL